MVVPIRCAWRNHWAGLALLIFCEQGLICFLLALRTAKPKQGGEVICVRSQSMAGAKLRWERAPPSSRHPSKQTRLVPEPSEAKKVSNCGEESPDDTRRGTFFYFLSLRSLLAANPCFNSDIWCKIHL